MEFRTWVVAAMAMVIASGCVGEDGGAKGISASQPTQADSESSPASGGGEGTITGSVVDPELVPIAGVTVTANPGNLSTITDAAGAYNLGPLEPGTYTLRGEKAGYKGKEAKVDVVAGEPIRMVLTLERLPSSDGYFETKTFAGYIQCQFHLTSPVTLNVPCSTFGVEYFGGPRTVDSYQYRFEITAPGFRELVFEAAWQPSNTVVGGAQFWIENPDDGTNYISGDGLTPIWHKATAGIKNDGSDAVFYATPDAAENFRMGMIGLGQGPSTVPNFYHWVEWRYTIYVSFFYNEAVTPDFTALA